MDSLIKKITKYYLVISNNIQTANAPSLSNSKSLGDSKKEIYFFEINTFCFIRLSV